MIKQAALNGFMNKFLRKTPLYVPESGVEAGLKTVLTGAKNISGGILPKIPSLTADKAALFGVLGLGGGTLGHILTDPEHNSYLTYMHPGARAGVGLGLLGGGIGGYEAGKAIGGEGSVLLPILGALAGASAGTLGGGLGGAFIGQQIEK